MNGASCGCLSQHLYTVQGLLLAKNVQSSYESRGDVREDAHACTCMKVAPGSSARSRKSSTDCFLSAPVKGGFEGCTFLPCTFDTCVPQHEVEA